MLLDAHAAFFHKSEAAWNSFSTWHGRLLPEAGPLRSCCARRNYPVS